MSQAIKHAVVGGDNHLPVNTSTAGVKKVFYRKKVRQLSHDIVLVEQPLQITLLWQEKQKIVSQIFSITMRTPDHDELLIIGLLLAEGVIKSFDDILQILPEDIDTQPSDSQVNKNSTINQWEVKLKQDVTPLLSSLERYQMTYSSCGLCGTTSLKSLELKNPQTLSKRSHWLLADHIYAMPTIMRAQQALFKKTGGSHAAALFDQNNLLLDVKEDIGRHNALDKLFGALAKSNQGNANKQSTAIVLVSGRISFEIVQKTVMAGISILIAVGAPSDLAIVAAKRFDLTLIGFANRDSFNIYHGEWRLMPTSQE